MCLKRVDDRNGRQLCFCMISVFLWGLAANGYGFLQSSFSHDSLAEFNGAMGSNSWKIQLARIWVPFYKGIFRTDLTLPWLVGLLSLVWIGLAVFLTVKMLMLEDKTAIFLTAGIFTANLAVTATAVTYMHDLDGNLFGMLCAVAAVYLWQRYRFGFLWGIPLISLCLGFYQSYLSVGVVLILLICIGWLLNGDTFRNVFRRGLLSIGMLVAGGVLYLLSALLMWKVTGIPPVSGDVNTLDVMLNLTVRSIIRLTVEAYLCVFTCLFEAVTPYPQWLIFVANGILLLLTAGMLTKALKGKGAWEIALGVALTILLPLGMNFTYVLTFGVVHDLMFYAIWLSYLPALALAYRTTAQNGLKKMVRWVCTGLICLLLYANVQTANVLYLKKDLEQDAFLSYMTRVVCDMEHCEEYVPGQTPVVFVGNPTLDTIPGFEKYERITGADFAGVTDMTEDYRARAYFQYILNNPAVIPGSDVFSQMAEDARVSAMPVYPQSGSIAVLDGVLVVKLA